MVQLTTGRKCRLYLTARTGSANQTAPFYKPSHANKSTSYSTGGISCIVHTAGTGLINENKENDHSSIHATTHCCLHDHRLLLLPIAKLQLSPSPQHNYEGLYTVFRKKSPTHLPIFFHIFMNNEWI